MTTEEKATSVCAAAAAAADACDYRIALISSSFSASLVLIQHKQSLINRH